MLYVAFQIWFELLLAFGAGALTMWWWQRTRSLAVTNEEVEHPTQPPLARADHPSGAVESPRPRVRPAQPSLPPSLVAMAEESATPTSTVPSGRRTPPEPPTPSPGPTNDDLTRIRGVGPVLQRQLHDLGVFSLREIAAWTPEDVDRVQSHLTGFPNRIRRDRWVAQAKDLVSGSP